jgi:phi13 family phage major tail protein
MNMPYNGTKVGLKDLYYALLISDASDGATYGTPVKIVGAITANINPNSNKGTLFADDGPMDTMSQLGVIEITLGIADIPLAIQAALLGSDAPTSGKLSKKATDVPPWVAIGFKSLKSNNSYRYVWLDKGKFGEPEDNSETKKDTVNFQTATIVGNFVKRDYDERWKLVADEDEGYTDGDDWFTDGPDSP